MITRDDFAINIAQNDRGAEQLGWQKGTRSELSISKYFATINGAKQECNELFFNQRLREIIDKLDIPDQISEHVEDGYYKDSEILVFLRSVKKLYDQKKKTEKKGSRIG